LHPKRDLVRLLITRAAKHDSDQKRSHVARDEPAPHFSLLKEITMKTFKFALVSVAVFAAASSASFAQNQTYADGPFGPVVTIAQASTRGNNVAANASPTERAMAQADMKSNTAPRTAQSNAATMPAKNDVRKDAFAQPDTAR
jgi:hypothetical protein